MRGRPWNLLLLAALLTHCGAPEPPRPDSLILISVDTLRADRLGLYGHHRATSPNLDRFAQQGFVFERALASSPNTGPSHMSLMTSLYPGRHGFTGYGDVLAAEHPTLAERLRDAGLRTAGFVDGGYLRGLFGFSRGFEVYDDTGGGIAAILPRAAAWLEANADRPFFLFLHCYDVHAPYVAPAPFAGAFHDEPYEGRFVPSVRRLERVWGGRERPSDEDWLHIDASYDEGILYTDAQLGQLFGFLEERGLLDRAAVIVTSDHGEELGEHGSVLHWQLYFRPNLHVPLVVRLPGGHGGEVRVAEQAQLVDVVPTVLELLGAPALGAAQGRSLVAAMERASRGEVESEPRAEAAAFAWWSMPHKSGLRSAVRGRFQLLFNEKGSGRGRLFDIEADPLARHEVGAQHPEEARELRELAMEVMRANRERAPRRERASPQVEREVRAQLEALGYATEEP